MGYHSVDELVHLAEEKGVRISDVVLGEEVASSGLAPEEVREKMRRNLAVMREALRKGLSEGTRSASGLVGGGARRLKEREAGKKTLTTDLARVIAGALAVSEVNAAMGRIVAGPTAGSAGVLPGVLLPMAEKFDVGEEALLMSLFTAAGVGKIITEKATVAGAEGGCQAECGSASGMAAAALVELAGGTPRQAAQAMAIALKNLLGLVCDPVAGLVEVPCVKRNAGAAANAVTAAEMALAGIESVIPPDEVIEAMASVGRLLPPQLKETAEGGLAATPTGRRIQRQLMGKEERKG
ncbi:MAG: L-serine ammonia-lyase, iron-sulfur-dependent, subunit alpha [Firmicutes bacterium]|nr:L-serine ammonia-lyase, iron-sulfur-dependent, subunit alpha [Bacillota bacterium]MCL5038754.1 L-serine ammonia-lyase, iron-sulfur-dependent, subunit alpha [Bacillota bacterium]